MDSTESSTHPETTRTVRCELHGDNREAFLCKHRFHSAGLVSFLIRRSPKIPSLMLGAHIVNG